MKGVVSAMMELIKDKEIRKTSTGLLLTTDEEIGGENGVGYLVKNNLVKTDCVIVPDGGENFKLILAEKGVLTVQILAEGRSVHGSRPWLGENAILKLIRLFEKINLSLPKLKPPAFWQPTVNLGMLQGGTAPNVVPGKAFMRLNFRFPEIKDEEIIIKLLDKEVSKIKGLSFEITSRGYPLINKPNDPFLNRIRQCAQAEGINLNLIKEHGASDGRFFSQKGIPVIMFKPVCSDSHIDNEWIDLKSLETFSKILKRFLLLEK